MTITNKIASALGTVAVWTAGIAVVAVCFVAAIALVGAMFDGIAEHAEQHDRCMKQATNGYEIERCR